MKHRFRFLGEAAPGGEQEWQLAEDEFIHIRNVLRLSAGDIIEATDGCGGWSVGSLEFRGKSAWLISQESGRESAPAILVELAVGALKPATVDDILPMLVELGVDHVRVYLHRGVDRNRIISRVVERWGKIVRSAVKQSKRNFLPKITTHGSLEELMSSTTGCRLKWLGSAGGANPLEPDIRSALGKDQGGRGSIISVLGGEKGLDPDEEQSLLKAGFQAVSFGPHILRAETACVAAAVLMVHQVH